MCVCVCVCVRERERETDRQTERETWPPARDCDCGNELLTRPQLISFRDQIEEEIHWCQNHFHINIHNCGYYSYTWAANVRTVCIALSQIQN